MGLLKRKSRGMTALFLIIAVLGFMVFTQFGCKKGGAKLPTTLAELVDYVSTAQDLLTWMQNNITYGWPGAPDMNAWRYLSPQQVFSQKQGDCTAQAAFEAYILKQNGYNCRLLWLERKNYSDHSVCYWREGSSLYYMEHAFQGNEGIYGPFNSVQQIGAQIYAQILAMDGKADSYSLYHYDDVPYGVDWFEFHNLLSPI